MPHDRNIPILEVAPTNITSLKNEQIPPFVEEAEGLVMFSPKFDRLTFTVCVFKLALCALLTCGLVPLMLQRRPETLL